MNQIETRFIKAFYDLVNSGYLVQHIKDNYKVIGKTQMQPNEDACIECEKYIRINYTTFIAKELHKDGRIDLYFSQQESISGYKIDFFLQSDVPNIYMGIEIDGHEWHEKSKEQASADKKRERKLLSLGVPCIRFTGSDVFTNPDGCARESLDIYFNYFFEVLLSTPENWNAYLRDFDK